MMYAIFSLIILLSHNANAVCLKSEYSPTGYKAVEPYSESATNKLIRCSLSIDIVRNKNGEDVVVAEHFLEEKRNPKGELQRRSNKQRVLDKIQKPSERKIRPKIIDQNFVINSKNSTSDPNNRRNLLPIFKGNIISHLKLNNIGLNQGLYAQNVVYCDENRTERSYTQLVALRTQTIYPNTDVPQNAFRTKIDVERSDTVIVSESPSGSTDTAELVIHIDHGNRYIYYTCRDVLETETVEVEQGERSSASQPKGQ